MPDNTRGSPTPLHARTRNSHPSTAHSLASDRVVLETSDLSYGIPRSRTPRGSCVAAYTEGPCAPASRPIPETSSPDPVDYAPAADSSGSPEDDSDGTSHASRTENVGTSVATPRLSTESPTLRMYRTVRDCIATMDVFTLPIRG